MTQPMYPSKHPEDYAIDFAAHMQAMTAEGLHSKSDIAVQLSWRDAELRRMHAENEALRAKEATPQQAAPAEPTEHQGMTIAGDGAAMLGRLMREQRQSRLGVYPDGNPNASVPQQPGLVPLADVLARVDACAGPGSAVRLALEREFASAAAELEQLKQYARQMANPTHADAAAFLQRAGIMDEHGEIKEEHRA